MKRWAISFELIKSAIVNQDTCFLEDVLTYIQHKLHIYSKNPSLWFGMCAQRKKEEKKKVTGDSLLPKIVQINARKLV